ncbi:helix-turn-helix transcriptional regulator [Alkalibacillus silvisoli]|uniref:HTH cro/C1-type domain-containing protein n=1 Tax=Alkalibacillus silvisoli TaxID=392823 RepID=A0ABN1AC14_9BACI
MIKFRLDKLLLEKNHMKVSELQKKSGVNKNTLYAIYKNQAKRVDLSVMERICKALDCTPADLLEYVEE